MLTTMLLAAQLGLSTAISGDECGNIWDPSACDCMVDTDGNRVCAWDTLLHTCLAVAGGEPAAVCSESGTHDCSGVTEPLTCACTEGCLWANEAQNGGSVGVCVDGLGSGSNTLTDATSFPLFLPDIEPRVPSYVCRCRTLHTGSQHTGPEESCYHSYPSDIDMLLATTATGSNAYATATLGNLVSQNANNVGTAVAPFYTGATVREMPNPTVAASAATPAGCTLDRVTVADATLALNVDGTNAGASGFFQSCPGTFRDSVTANCRTFGTGCCSVTRAHQTFHSEMLPDLESTHGVANGGGASQTFPSTAAGSSPRSYFLGPRSAGYNRQVVNRMAADDGLFSSFDNQASAGIPGAGRATDISLSGFATPPISTFGPPATPSSLGTFSPAPAFPGNFRAGNPTTSAASGAAGTVVDAGANRNLDWQNFDFGVKVDPTASDFVNPFELDVFFNNDYRENANPFTGAPMTYGCGGGSPILSAPALASANAITFDDGVQFQTAATVAAYAATTAAGANYVNSPASFGTPYTSLLAAAPAAVGVATNSFRFPTAGSGTTRWKFSLGASARLGPPTARPAVVEEDSYTVGGIDDGFGLVSDNWPGIDEELAGDIACQCGYHRQPVDSAISVNAYNLPPLRAGARPLANNASPNGWTCTANSNCASSRCEYGGGLAGKVCVPANWPNHYLRFEADDSSD